MSLLETLSRKLSHKSTSSQIKSSKSFEGNTVVTMAISCFNVPYLKKKSCLTKNQPRSRSSLRSPLLLAMCRKHGDPPPTHFHQKKAFTLLSHIWLHFYCNKTTSGDIKAPAWGHAEDNRDQRKQPSTDFKVRADNAAQKRPRHQYRIK